MKYRMYVASDEAGQPKELIGGGSNNGMSFDCRAQIKPGESYGGQAWEAIKVGMVFEVDIEAGTTVLVKGAAAS